MPMTWNNEADVRLFVNVLRVHDFKMDYPALAEAMGENCTTKAIMHRITKLKAVAKEAEAGGIVLGTGDAPIDGPAAANGTKKGRGGDKTADGGVKVAPARKKAKKGTGEDGTAAGAGSKKRGRPKKNMSQESQGVSEPKAEEADSEDVDDSRSARNAKRFKKENIQPDVDNEGEK